MNLSKYIINDIKPLLNTNLISDFKELFNQLSYSHVPVMDTNAIYLGCVSATDALCFESEKYMEDCNYVLEPFFVRSTTNWLDVLEAFAQNDTNLMPVLDETNTYLGYFELNDIIGLFNETPFFSEAGGVLVVEKGFQDYSFSEVSQIVESNNGKLLGAFISKIENDVAQITLKIGNVGLNDIMQTFRRYSYNIISGNEEDSFMSNLKERSDYLNKYLNI